MGDVEEPFRAEYEVVFDPAANMRINKAYARTLLRAWFHYGFRWGVILATLFLILTYVVLVWANRAEPAYILMAASFSGIATGILGSLWMLRTQVANCNANVDKGWHCVFSDEAWSYSDPEGASMSIPWSIMKLEWEHKDAFLIRFGRAKTGVFVYRKPLQDAGLEEAFRSRIGKKP